jgi:hypothetical protein
MQLERELAVNTADQLLVGSTASEALPAGYLLHHFTMQHVLYI